MLPLDFLRPSDDTDPAETREWLDALRGVIATAGPERARFLLRSLDLDAERLGLDPSNAPSAYRNTIPLERQGPYPGDVAMEKRIASLVRWNALAMVVRANAAYGDLGGHIASYASAAEIFETGFNHFFRASYGERPGDLVFFQPHSAPGVYARAFLEGRFDEAKLANFRRELGGEGLSSYPHPWLMPDFWQFPTGSMGIGPINAIYHARFMRYLGHRGLADTSERHVWGVFGDGEMDEPESIGGLTLAARERLDNLTFVINCNLQRLDGPVRGNGRIIEELESLFAGAGWNVIKVLWGSQWDALFARDTENVLLRRFAETVDGAYQTLGANDGSYNREHFFDRDPELAALTRSMSAADIEALDRGGHDVRKLHAAFAAARAHRERPTVVLVKTKKGYGIARAESSMTAHQHKKLDLEGLRDMRDRFALPLSDDDLAEMRFFRPAPESAESRYLHARREELGGYLPTRRSTAAPLAIPPIASYAAFALAGSTSPMSTTMAFVRMLTGLIRDPALGKFVVPIVADEARTFGMDNLFRQVGIYAPFGQLYEPQDAESMLYYREATDGQLLEEGITEAGALSSWVAAATSYSVHGVATLPFYIYYSMFGFQRVGDLIWAAADQRSRGFLIGATAGRTTLGGEGLQHQDGSSHVVAATVPNCRAYDPAYAYELAVIVDCGARAMGERGEDVFYYITVANENFVQPAMPTGIEDDIVCGLYRVAGIGEGDVRVRLVGSGPILREALAAGELLAREFGIASDVFSATSYTELDRDARACDRWNARHPLAEPRVPHVRALLGGEAPVIAASDYVRAYVAPLALHLDAPFVALGTDGFGRSDTRADLRAFFEVDGNAIAYAALAALARGGTVTREALADAATRLGIDVEAEPSWTR
jgi:pyruvate dehydrogenase E1 component